MSISYCKALSCELNDENHEWIDEEVYGDYDYYGQGVMKLRHCNKCQVTEYIEFISDDNYVTEIMTIPDEEFEKLLHKLKSKVERNQEFLKAQSQFSKKYKE